MALEIRLPEPHIIQSRFSIEEIRTINVMIVGDSSVGKSTFIKSIMGLKPVEEETKYSRTEHPVIHELYVRTGEKNYCLRFVDTPGFNEVRSKDEVSRSDSAIMADIVHHARELSTSYHLILSCFKRPKNPQEHQRLLASMNELTVYFMMDYPENTGILFTHFEYENEDGWLQTIEDSNFQLAVDYAGENIFYTGCRAHYANDAANKLNDIRQSERLEKFLNRISELEPIFLSQRNGKLSSRRSITVTYNEYNSSKELHVQHKNLLKTAIDRILYACNSKNPEIPSQMPLNNILNQEAKDLIKLLIDGDDEEKDSTLSGEILSLIMTYEELMSRELSVIDPNLRDIIEQSTMYEDMMMTLYNDLLQTQNDIGQLTSCLRSILTKMIRRLMPKIQQSVVTIKRAVSIKKGDGN